MFGLLKACNCTRSRSERELRRLAYCGTCKSLGTLFGQKSRLFLNHDVVFLAELLLSMRKTAGNTAVEVVGDGGAAFKSFNCMAMPSPQGIPKELEIAASVNALLAEFKLVDKQSDSPGLQWQIASKIFSGEFASAARVLERLEFPLSEAFEWLALQAERERACWQLRSDSPIAPGELDSNLLLAMAEPTAEITRLFFENGARACGLSPSVALQFSELGKSFGQLVYVLDALEDWRQDFRRGEFNALRVCSTPSSFDRRSLFDGNLRRTATAPGAPASSRHLSADLGPSSVMPEPVRIFATSLVREALVRIKSALYSLQMRPGAADDFAERFRSNTETRLRKVKSAADSNRKNSVSSARSRCSNSVAPRVKDTVGRTQGLADGITRRGQNARQFVARVLAANETTNRLSSPLQVLAGWYCFVLAFLFPRQADAADSLRGCFELPFNLIFLSGAVASIATGVSHPLRRFSVLAAGGAPLPPGGPMPGPIPGLGAEEIERKRQKAEDHGCCDCCGDCCESCDCSSCNCDGCGDCGGCVHCGGSDCGGCDCNCCDGCDCGGCHGCDCGGCDCGGADCGGCDCNCH